MSERLNALHSSARHLREVVSGLDVEQLTGPAYPSEWTIADTMSHVGSGAVIMQHLFLQALHGEDPVEGFAQSVWDSWNAKSPDRQVADALAADQEFLDVLAATPDDQRGVLRVRFGQLELDFDRFVGMRLGEHVVHTWDVEESVRPGAELAVPAASLLLDQVHFIVGRSGVPTGEPRTITVRTHEPARDFNVVVEASSVTLVDTVHSGPVDVEISAEAFVRLIYGRLDAQAGVDDGAERHLEVLRETFPGF